MNIPYGRQSISEEDIQAVIDVLRSDWLTQGPAIEEFERKVAEYCGASYAVAVSSATAALHIACAATGLEKGDRLWTSPNTFVASANCGLYCGAEVDFVDIDCDTYNMSPICLEEKLVQAKKTNMLPKVIVPVHFAGQSCDMANIYRLASEYGITVIEDASHAIGGSYQNKRIGSCQYSDMAVFSFHPVKIVTTGEGGMVVTNDEKLYRKLLLLRSHGITRKKEEMTTTDGGSWYYEQIDLGYNYRITDIQAALGTSQMRRIDEFVARRHRLARRYDELLLKLPVITPVQIDESYSALHLYPIRLNLQQIQKTRREVFDALRQAEIGVNVHYIPVHTQPYYRKLGFAWGDFPEAEKYYAGAISLPLYFDLSFESQDYVVSTLEQVLR